MSLQAHSETQISVVESLVLSSVPGQKKGVRSLLLFSILEQWEDPHGEICTWVVPSFLEGNLPTVWGCVGRRRVWARIQEYLWIGRSHLLCRDVWEHGGSSLGEAVLPCSFLATALWTVPAMGTPGSSQPCWGTVVGELGLAMFPWCHAASLLSLPAPGWSWSILTPILWLL